MVLPLYIFSTGKQGVLSSKMALNHKRLTVENEFSDPENEIKYLSTSNTQKSKIFSKNAMSQSQHCKLSY